MNRRRMLCGLALAVVPWIAHAQSAPFPSKPLRIVVPFSGGSGADTGARVYGEMLSRLVVRSETPDEVTTRLAEYERFRRVAETAGVKPQ